MLKKLMLLTLMMLTFSTIANSEETQEEKQSRHEFERCMERQPPCPHDGESLEKLKTELSKEEINKILSCRVGRLLECSKPKEDR